jgi:hypothetical protein
MYVKYAYIRDILIIFNFLGWAVAWLGHPWLRLPVEIVVLVKF